MLFLHRGHNPTEAEVQDMINETDHNNSGKVTIHISKGSIKTKASQTFAEDHTDYKVFDKSIWCKSMEQILLK